MHNLNATLENQINLYSWTQCLQILNKHGFITNERNQEMEEFSGYFLENCERWGGVDIMTERAIRDFLRYDD